MTTELINYQGLSNSLLNRDDGTPSGVGSVLTFPAKGDYTDYRLEPGECVRVDYEIGMSVFTPFSFYVDVYGCRQ